LSVYYGAKQVSHSRIKTFDYKPAAVTERVQRLFSHLSSVFSKIGPHFRGVSTILHAAPFSSACLWTIRR